VRDHNESLEVAEILGEGLAKAEKAGIFYQSAKGKGARGLCREGRTGSLDPPSSLYSQCPFQHIFRTTDTKSRLNPFKSVDQSCHYSLLIFRINAKYAYIHFSGNKPGGGVFKS
jgi:hypothetical protein